MLVVQFYNELGKGFKVPAVYAGWVVTDMGNVAGSGGIPVTECVCQCVFHVLEVVESLAPQDSAKFFNFDGTTVPW